MIVGETKPPLSDLQHFGVPGMHWGQKKAQLAGAVVTPPEVTATAQVGHELRKEIGRATSDALIAKYGKTAVRVGGKAVLKGGRAVFSNQGLRDSIFVYKLLGRAAVGVAKGGKAYLKTALALGKLGAKIAPLGRR